MQIDKQTAARYMINCAIRNVFNGECPVSNHVIILSAKEILLGVARSTGTRLKLDFSQFVKGEYQTAFINFSKERYNFFKHANVDHDFEADITNIQYTNEMELLMVIDHYNDLFGQISSHMQRFQFYCTIQYPKIFNYDEADIPAEQKQLIRHYAKQLTEDGRESLCTFLAGELRTEAASKLERAEAMELSFADREEVAARNDDLKGPFFKRRKQPN